MKKIKSLLKKLNSQGKTTKEDAGRDYLAEQLEPRVLYSGTVAPDVSADDQPVQEAPSTPDNEPKAIGADGAPSTAIEAAQQASAEMQQFVSEGIQIASGETDISEDQSVVLLDAGAFSAMGGTVGALTQEVAAGALDAAAERWSVSGVLTEQQADALGDFSVQVADLEGDLLLSVSEDNSTIVLDIDAAGREWFVDGSPLDDSEFTDRVSLNGFRADSDAAIAGIDVLTVLMESQGRLLGLDSVSVGRDVSATGIEDGLRRIPFADESLTNPDVVTTSLVSDLANAAAQRWEDSGLSEAQIEALADIEYRVVDLDSGIIGSAEDGVISIDLDAAGKGWFVDLTPQDDSEFSDQTSATSLSASEGTAAEGVDLLSVIMHEQGHILGLEHVEDSSTVTIMTDVFGEGDRRLLEDGQAEGATPGSLDGVHFATTSFQQGVSPTVTYAQDAVYIRQSAPTTNQNADPDQEVIVGFTTNTDQMRGLFEFDISSIALTDNIDSVSLVLRTGGGQGGPLTVNVHEYNFDIVETAATWNAPATGDTTAGGTLGTLLTSTTFDPTVGASSTDITFGDSSAFRTAVSNALAGDGILRLILTRPDNSGTGNRFARFDDDTVTTAGNRPELIIESTPITADSFDSYTDGANLNGLNGGSGWTSAWSSLGTHATIESTHPFSGSGNAVQIQPTADLGDTGSFLSRDFAAVTDTLYVGMEINKSTGFDNADFINFQFRDSSGSDQLGFGVRNQTDNPIFARVQGGSTVSVNTSTNAEPGTTYQVIAKISKDGSTNYNRVDLYIDPTGTTEPGAADATATAATGVSSLSRLNVRHFSPELGDVFWFDNLQLSSTFEGALAPDPTAPPAIITPVIAESTSTIGTPRIIDATIDGSGLAGGGNSFNVLAETHEFVPQATTDTYWLSSAGAVSRGDEVLTFTLPSASDIDAVHQWVYTRGGSGGDRGLQTFDISFSTDGGTTYPTTIGAATLGNFTKPVANTSVESETKTFAQQTGVTHVRLSNLQNFGDTSYFGLTEIRFGGTPSVAPSGATVEIGDPLIPDGLGAGDTFQLVFVTSTKVERDLVDGSNDGIDGSDVNQWNDYVNTVAASSSLAGISDLNWSAIVSVGAVEAKDNALVSGPVYRTDGELVATDFADMWDSSIPVPIKWNENGVEQDTNGGSGSGRLVWTGATGTGGISNRTIPDQLSLGSGDGNSQTGNADSTDDNWINTADNLRRGVDTALRVYALSEVITINGGGETIPPTLASSDIVDDKGGAPVGVGETVTYTVTFSEDILDTTVTADDFSNAGDARFSVGAVTETSAGVFTVEMTPVSAGTLQLQVPAGASIQDEAGNLLDTTSAILDDTIITVEGTTVAFDDPLVPAGLSSGDTFQLVFVTSTKIERDLVDGSDDGSDDSVASQWDTYVNGVASGSTLAGIPDLNWSAIVSVDGIDANDHAVVSGPVYRTDGTLIANDFADMWDSSIVVPIKWNENGVEQDTNGGSGSGRLVWTGSNGDGTIDSRPLGNGADDSRTGNADSNTDDWVNTSDATRRGVDTALRVYALSEVITVGAAPLAAVDDDYTSNPITEDEVLNIGSSGSVLINDTGTGLDAPTLITGVTVPTDSANLSGQNGGFNRLAEYVVNGAGFDGTAHDNTASGGMWMESNGDKTTGFITFDLGANYDLDNVHVWNYNENGLPNRGANLVEILVSDTAGGTFTSLGDYNFAQAPGTNGYLGEVIDLSDKPAANDARMVRFNIKSNHGGGEMGLSEVRFYAADTDTTLTSYDTTSANGATVSVNPDGSFTYDPTVSPTIQALNDGDVLTDTFTYTLAGEEPAVIYEGFDYGAGGLNGKGGTSEKGLDGTWTANSSSLVVEDSLEYGELVTTPGAIGDLSNNVNRFGGARAISSSALAGNGLLDEGAELWFSLEMGYDTGGNVTNSRLGFALANSSFNGGNYNYWINDEGVQLGSGLGVTLGRFSGQNGRVAATQFQDIGSGDALAGNVYGTVSSPLFSAGEHGLIVGKIVWGAGGANDTIELYQPDSNLNLGAAISTLSVNVDQSSYDTITFARGDKVVLDEIRFGASYDDVNGPTTSTATVSVEVSGVNDFKAVDDDYTTVATDEDTVLNIPNSLLTLDSMAAGDYEFSADGQTFEARVEQHDDAGWLLIGRGRQGWEFDTDGQGNVDDVNQGLGTSSAFAPAAYSDAIINDLLAGAGLTMADVEIRISRASTPDGTGEYQDVRWRDFTAHGTADTDFTWDFENNNTNRYGVTQEIVNAPAGLAGAEILTVAGRNTRDSNGGGIDNDSDRVFTWPWGGHASQKGFSYGQTVTNGSNSATSFIWESGNENHAIPYTEVYIRALNGTQISQSVLGNDTVSLDPVVVASFDVNNGGSATQSGFAGLSSTGTGTQNGITLTSSAGMDEYRDRGAVSGSSDSDILRDFGFENDASKTITFDLTGLKSNTEYELRIFSFDDDANNGVTSDWYEGAVGGTPLLTHTNNASDPDSGDFTLRLTSDATGAIQISGASSALVIFNGMTVAEIPQPIVAYDATSAKGAAVTVNPDGSFTYDPTGSAELQALAAGENTTDTFTYTISEPLIGNGTLLGHYPLDEIDGSSTEDTTGGADGSINGGITVSSSGKLGNAFNFTGGTGEFVGIPNHPWGTDAFTASIWYLPDNTGRDPLADWTNNGSSPQTFLIRASGSTLQTYIRSGSSQVGGSVSFPTETLSTTEFNHVVMTYDGQNAYTYLNGELSTTVHSFASPRSIGNGTSADIAAIGGRGSSEGDYVGLADDVAFWSEDLSDGKVSAVFNLANEADLTYDAGKANLLFRVFDGGVPAVTIGDLRWSRASGLGGNAGDVVDLGGGNYFVNIDGTSGVASSEPITATVTVQVNGVNDAPEFMGEESITTNTGSDGLSGHVRRGADETGSFGGSTIAIKNAGTNSSVTRKGYIRMDVSDVDYPIAEASLDLTISLKDAGIGGYVQTFHVYGLNDGSQDSWDSSTATWFNAPGNNTGSAFEADLSETSFLGTFTVESGDGVGDTVTFTDSRLADFLNADTNGLATLIIGRTGSNDNLNFGFAGDSTGTPPTLNLSAGTVPTGEVVETADVVGGTDSDPADLTGKLVFRDVDLSDTHIANLVSTVVTGGSASLTADQENALLDNLTINPVQNDTPVDGFGEIEWTYSVPNSEIDFLAKGETVEVTGTVTVYDKALIEGVGVENVSSENGGFNRLARYSIDGSGLTGDEHNNGASGVAWMANGTTATVTYDLEGNHDLTSLHVWNYNEAAAGNTDRGANLVEILVSDSVGGPFTSLGDFTFARADGTNSYTGESIDLSEFSSLTANTRLVQLNVKSNYGDGGQVGLSEIQFFELGASDTATVSVTITGQNDMPEFETDATVTTLTGEGGTAGQVRLGSNETGSFGGTQFHVKNSGNGSTTRKGYIRMDVSELNFPIAEASLDLTVSREDISNNSHVQTIHVYGLTNESLDNWDTSTATWAGAPGNNTGSPHEADATDATFLGTFTYQGSEGVGVTKSFSDPRLVDFLNSDTNGQVTFILGRTGPSGGANLLFAGNTHASLAPPTLNVATATLTEGTITETADVVGGTDADPADATGTLVFSDVDLSDTHSASVDGANVVGKTATLTQEQEDALLDNLTLGAITENADGSGSFDWTYDVPNSEIDFLAAGETVELEFAVSTTDNQSILFADTFDRPNNGDLDASTSGMSGSLGALSWGELPIPSNSALDINNNTLRTNASSTPGQQGGIAWPEHNFIDADILAAGEFTVSVDIAEQSSGGDGRIAGFAIGQSLADLQSRTSSSVASTADFQVGYDDIGNTRGITIYHNGLSQGRIAFTASTPDTLSATFKVTDFNAGSTVDYELFLDGVSITTGTTTWSGTEENYISLQSNSTNDTRFDNFSVSAPSSDTATVNVTITGTNDAPEIADSAEVSTINTNTGSDGVSGHVRRGSDETGSFATGQTIAIKNSGNNGSTTRKGYIRMDVSEIDYTVADASLDLTISLRDSNIGNNVQTFHVYGMNDGDLDNWNPSTATWFNAPANNTGSAFEADLNEATFLGTFTSGGSDRVGDTLSFSDPRLADFLNADTNGLATFIIGRTGTDDFRNFGFASDNHASLAPPTLNISAAHNPEGQVTEDLDVTTLTDEGIIAFSDVDLTDTHTATVQPSALNTYGGTLTLGAVVDDSTSDSGHVRWTYQVDNSAVQALAVGQTDTETFTVLIDDGNGGSTTETVEITITGTNDAPEITQDDTPVALTETDAPLDATGTFDVSDIDLSDTVDATIEDEITVGGTGVVSLPASLTANDNQALKDMFSLTSTNPVIASGTATATLNSNDFIVGESSGSSATTPGYYTSSTNGGSTIVGVGGPGTNRTDRAMILGYTLPTLAPGETVDSVDFSFEITRARNGNGGILPNLDVYLLNTATPETTGTDFFYQGADDPSADVAFVGKTTVGIGAGGEVTFPDDSEDRTFTLTGDALRMFKSFYTDNVPNQSEVFFRFNLDAAASLGSFDRYRIDTAADESGVEITTANETGTIDWEFDSDPEAFDFLAKDETLELTYTVSATDGQQDVLFADNFNRDNSTDLDASSNGMSGSLGALTWEGIKVPAASTLDINDNTLRIDAASTPGGNGGIAYVDHNFIDPGILAAGEFTVSVDITELTSGGDGRLPGFGIGQSLAEISGLGNASGGNSPADVFVAYDDVGGTRGITILHNGTLDSRTAFSASRPDTLSATFRFDDMNAGSAINYEVFLDGVSIATGSTIWSGTDENYISLQSNTTGNTRFDNFAVAVPSSDTATVSVTITGTNDAPIATLAGNDINENGTTTVTGTIVDPDLSDTHTVIIDWDDPNNDTDSTFDVNKSTRDLMVGDTFNSAEDAAVILTIDAVDTTTGMITYSVQRQYLDDGLAEATFNPATPAGNATASDVSNVSVEVTDNIGASDTAGFDLIVSNVLPVMENVAISADVINENGSVTVSGDIVDPGTLDAFRVRITWGDGKLDTVTLPAGSTSFSLDHVYDVGGRSYNIRIQLLDDDLGVANAGLAVRVINVPPTLEANPIPDVVVGETSVLTGSFTDPGLVLPHTVVVDWGDGTSSSFEVPPTGTLEAGDRVRGRDGSILTVTDVDITTGEVNFTVSHEYENDGIFNVSVTVGDETFTVTAQLTATVFLIGPTDTTPGIFTNQPGENNLVGILSIFRNMGDTGLFVGFRADDAEDDRLLDGFESQEGTPDFLGDLTLAPFFAGTTQPGATVVVILRDEVGNEVASTTIISDLAGNWTATFPELEYDEGDYNVEIQVTNPIWSSIAGSFESQIAAFNGSLLGAAREFEGLTAGQIIGIAVDTQALDQVLQNEKGLGKQ